MTVEDYLFHPKTPNISYVNVHAVLEERRHRAKPLLPDDPNSQGPRVIVVGPTDSGKSTFSKMLLSWAAKKGWKPTFVDLDIGQGAITIPECIAATPIEMPIDPVEGIPLDIPLVYFYGHTTPSGSHESLKIHFLSSNNVDLNKVLVNELAQVVERQLSGNAESRASGMAKHNPLSHSSLPPPTLPRSSSAMPRIHIPVMNVGTSVNPPQISAGSTMEEGGRYKSPPAAHKCIFHLLNILGVLLQTANILQASNNTNIYELMNNISLLCGTLALVLLVLLLVPAFGWFTLACWAVYFVIIGTRSYQTLRTLCADAVPYVRDKMKELMRRLNGSEEPQNERV
ncbi:mRNA cleavage and polyadenylation factor CLP1-like [Malus sylvestris]|uniref:mRNA cleavage and polyadenylation factor CLP1-like n=1 Tax=Malus sylvestris TaxID=3752 RepID=UPI0021ABA5AB|nr:mRNA cleavage and polyadenylation factor CLP1-like [Malus sylvestris]